MFVVEFTEFLPFRIKLHFALCVKSGERFELLENLPFLFSNIIIFFFFEKKKLKLTAFSEEAER